MARSSTLEERLAAIDNDFGPAWNPKPGETLIASIKFYSTGQSAYGPVRTVICETEGGERVSIWLSAEVLRAKFAELRPKPGEKFACRYDGKHPERGYRRYAMVVDRPEDEPDFAPLGGERDFPSDDAPKDVDVYPSDPFGDEPMPAGYARETISRPAARPLTQPARITRR